MWPFTRTPVPIAAPAPKRARPMFSTHDEETSAGMVRERLENRLRAAAPRVPKGVGMDSGNFKSLTDLGDVDMGEALFAWFGAQTFIGHQMAAVLAQHWLIDKACWLPARDAVRHGFEVKLEDYELDSPELKAIGKANRRYRINQHMQHFIAKGRVFGIRVAIFKVRSLDPLYYEKPFNPDGVRPGTYEGIVQVDPYWCAPELDTASISDPASGQFYEPTWWMINGKRYHRSHLAVYVPYPVADMLKPAYQYGGVPLPQRVMERAYAAERTANEAPQLAMTKRLNVWKTDLAMLLANQDQAAAHMQYFVQAQNNFGVKIVDTDDTMEQHDTTLNDLDAVIMTQYQIVAAIANVPGTKLLGTTPKGFNSTGEYEEASYHEELETIQENDLDPFLERHMLLVLRSDIEPKFGKAPGSIGYDIDWAPLDSPTAEEYAKINKTNAETDKLLADAGAIDGMDIRARISSDRNSGYTGLPELSEKEAAELEPVEVDPADVAIAAQQGAAGNGEET